MEGSLEGFEAEVRAGHLSTCGCGDLTCERFDVVVNATSASLRAKLPPVPAEAFAWWRGVRPPTQDLIRQLTVPLV